MVRKSVLVVSTALILMLVATPAQPSNASSTSSDTAALVAWFEMALDLIRTTPGFSPPVASRALGYLGVAAYESVVPGLPGHRSLATQLNGLDPLPLPPQNDPHWPTVANAALARMMKHLFPSSSPEAIAAIEQLESELMNSFVVERGSRDVMGAVRFGHAVADAIHEWSMGDGGHEGYMHGASVNYVPREGVGMWIQTPPNFSGALQPGWGQNRPFVLKAADECPVAAPPAYSEDPTSEFYEQALEVYEKGRTLTNDERAIALFWADDPGRTSTPPGHWVAILNQVLVGTGAPLEIAAEAYARLGIALADSFIACWHAKYVYNLIRPISYIQQVIDPNWNAQAITDAVLTPPFPEYPSGHSVQSAAAAQVLTDIFGEIAFTDRTHESRGLGNRSFSSFMDAAEEAAISRLYGGIHFRAAIEQGLAQGRCIAERVATLQLRDAQSASTL